MRLSALGPVAFTAAFSLLERWSLVDALYFTTTTLATCGFGDLRPASYCGRALTSVCGIVGVGLRAHARAVGCWD